MTTRVWNGQAPAVAQSDTIEVTAYDAASEYRLTVNGETIASASGGGSVTAIASALVTAWNAATGHPYARPISATGTAGVITLQADTAGIPFTVAGAVIGGTGTIGAASNVIANAGPNDWDTAGNWSGAAVPVNGDEAVFRNGDVPALWGLAQSGVTLAALVVEQSYTGEIGLNKRAVVTGAAGSAATGKPEYREDYLDIGWDEARIGEIVGPGSPAGSGRLKCDNAKAGASTTTIHNTASSSVDANLPAVRLLFAHASADVLVRNAGGGVGIAVDDAGETSTVGDVSVADRSQASRVFVGAGVTLETFTQDGGDSEIRAAAGVTGITVNGGHLAIEGQGYTVGTLTVNGGICYPNSTPTGGAAIETLSIDGGTVDARRSRGARTWTAVSLKAPGSTLLADSDVITITGLNVPTGGYGIQIV